MFFNCINLIKISIKHKKKGFIILNKKNNINILKIFIKIKLIKFIKIQDNKIIVYINYIKNKPIFKNIVNLYKPGNKKFITLKTLKKITLKHNWILIISSPKGIINNFDALKIKTGGLLLSKIWN